MTHADRCRGSLLALALGDALGAPHEGGLLEQFAWKGLGLLKPGLLRYTDDAEMALASADSLVARGGFDVDHMARTWAERASSTRGYGPGARRVLRRIAGGEDWRSARTAVFPDGSFGNGAAMRVAPLALAFADDPATLDAIVREASSVTHAHPLGIQGALIVARAVALALGGLAAGGRLTAHVRCDDLDPLYQDRLRVADDLLREDAAPATVARRLGHGVLATESAVTAVYLADRFLGAPFEELMRYTIALGGDVDTLAAMAGGIWGAHRGAAALPAAALAQLEDRDRFEAAATALAAR